MKQINSQKIQTKLRNKFIKHGIKMIGPETIFFSEDTKIGKNVTIDPYVVIGPKVNIGNNTFVADEIKKQIVEKARIKFINNETLADENGNVPGL